MALETTAAERIAWQRRAASCLAELLKLAAKDHLPPITWRIGDGGPSVVGESLDRSPSVRRADFVTWKAALTAVSGRPPDNDYEHDLGGDNVRLIAGWTHLPVRLAPADGPSPGVDVTLVASIRPDERNEGDG